MVSVSVPGKVILMGEHAVVYGKPALVTAINRRMTISIEGRSHDDAPPKTHEHSSYINHILRICEQACHIDLIDTVKLHISSSIPSGYHLGSSGSLAAGIVGAVFLHAGIPFDEERMIDIAQLAENFIHTTSSGVDPAIAFTGGLLFYQKKSDGTRILRRLSSDHLSVMNHFFLLDTGKPKESTGTMVSHVALMAKEKNALVKAYMDENEKQTMRLVHAIEQTDERELISAMIRGEETLEGMGVVSPKVISCIREIEKAGGSAKITGGGGKSGGVGFMVCYHTDRTVIETIAEGFKFSVSSVVIGDEGLRIEKK